MAGRAFRYDGKHLRIPEREVVPKRFRQPHPPLWVTGATPEGLENAGRMGVGVLATIMFSPIETIGEHVGYYRRGLEQCKACRRLRQSPGGMRVLLPLRRDRRPDDRERGRRGGALVHERPGEGLPAFRASTGSRPVAAACRCRELEQSSVAPSDDEGRDLDDPMPVIRLMNRLHAGLDVDPVEVYEALRRSTRSSSATSRSAGASSRVVRSSVSTDHVSDADGPPPHEQVMKSIRRRKAPRAGAAAGAWNRPAAGSESVGASDAASGRERMAARRGPDERTALLHAPGPRPSGSGRCLVAQ
ncbi:MAG: LLM class flavin-dependent oxidoreductase [Deltaproteobacteria bacterium]|nr:LLM class flavin-dependent oxidoreductase [Deltaproteobacteria bacterium]